jgi:2-polyprenyl-3-methyl-5-hydroxy-6-metoxy-1,4-benzoquinol methylase
VDKSILVRLFGFPATLIHGDLLVLTRWQWLRRRLPRTASGERFVDIGCGSGAFTIGAALRGYESTGLSWDEANRSKAVERAAICGAKNVTFPIQDVRRLDERVAYRGYFDVAICFENIEHILDDRKLMRDIAACLKPGGMLLLTAPYYFFRPISRPEIGPYFSIEDGSHVRRGYTKSMLVELCNDAGLVVEEIGSCSGFLSQKITALLRAIRPVALGWLLTLPLRILPPLFDGLIGALTGWPNYSICLVACKPRF